MSNIIQSNSRRINLLQSFSMNNINKGIAPKLPVFDGHNDTLLDLFLPERGEARSFFEESKKGHIDLPRARKGGVFGSIFSIFAPPPKTSPESDPMYGYRLAMKGLEIKYSPVGHEYARELTDSVLDFAHDLEGESNGQMKIVRRYGELLGCLENKTLAVVLHIEGAEAINKDLSNLRRYYDRGVRSLGLVWSRPNEFGTGVPFAFPRSPDTGPGLKEAGRALVKECNRMGIMLDLAHINEKGFWDVASISTLPFVVTHSNVWALCPSTRNLTDKQIDAIGESNGVIGISFVPENINSNGKPDPQTPLARIADHIDYVVRRTGVDHVALGSDFDGAKMPDSMRDVTHLPNLLNTLKGRDYDEESLKKIACKNWLRVLKESWKMR